MLIDFDALNNEESEKIAKRIAEIFDGEKIKTSHMLGALALMSCFCIDTISKDDNEKQLAYKAYIKCLATIMGICK